MYLETAADELARFLTDHAPVWVLTGAGISLASGIPTYRDQAGNWQRNDPIKHQEFMQLERKRQRYWARSMVGWKAVDSARPNAAHRALSRLQKAGLVGRIVTQNVDGLHDRADSTDVIDLHGRMDTVVCMDCGSKSRRADLQHRLERLNPELADYAAQALPDGDAHIDDYPMDKVKVPDCEPCGGLLKPDVVFFGDNVPRNRVHDAMDSLAASGALLVIGSSLQVLSGYRFCLKAAEDGIPIASINPGRTRADDLLTASWPHNSADLLQSAVSRLATARTSDPRGA